MKYSLKNKNLYIIILSISAVLLIFYLNASKLNKNYVSHSNEPKIGDRVQNNNPSCKHYKSVGTVKDIKSLKGDKGKTITYQVDNNGSTYSKGQTLVKTLDQLCPL